MIKIIAIDPGVTTGFCYAQVPKEGGILEYHPFQMVDDVDEIWERIYKFQPDHIIIEDFEYRSGKQRAGLNLFPVQLIGVARLYQLRHPESRIYIQKAATGKAFYTDTVLKSEGLYVRGKPHGMDASRHLLQWFTFLAGWQYNPQTKPYAKLLKEWSDRSE